MFLERCRGGVSVKMREDVVFPEAKHRNSVRQWEVFFAVTSFFSPVSLIFLVASDNFFCYYFKCSYAMGAALRIGRIINYIDRSTKHSLSL